MALKTLALVIACIALLAVLVAVERVRRRRLIERLFGDRNATLEEPAFLAHFSNAAVTQDVVLAVKLILAEELNTDMARLRPSDNFSKNLRPLLKEDSMADVAIIEGLERHFKIRIDDREAEGCKSVEDVVNLVQQKTGSRNGI